VRVFVVHRRLIVTRAKGLLPNLDCTLSAEISPPPAATEWFRLLVRDVICSERVPFRLYGEVIGVHSAFVVPGDLDL